MHRRPNAVVTFATGCKIADDSVRPILMFRSVFAIVTVVVWLAPPAAAQGRGGGGGQNAAPSNASPIPAATPIDRASSGAIRVETPTVCTVGLRSIASAFRVPASTGSANPLDRDRRPPAELDLTLIPELTPKP